MSTPTPAATPWERVARLRPALRAHARIHCHRYRGEPWFVLQDRAASRHYRFDPRTHRALALMDGEHTLEQIRVAAGGEQPLEEAELMRLVAQLQGADLLRLDAPADVRALFARRAQVRRQQWTQRLLRPLMMKVPLLDPERLLAWGLPAVRPLFGGWALLAWVATLALALLVAATHATELAEHWAARALDPRNLLLLWFLYPVVKGLHELGHAFAVRVWGGEVHEMGVMLLVLMPVPYVDASAASAFPDKRRRMVVGAAGILVEVFLAAVGVVLWAMLEPGLARDLAYNLALVGGVSTVLFNGNPLVRFDGYYVLADAIEIPNLAARSQQYLGYLARRYLFGMRDAPSPVLARGERGWFVGYGIAAALYRPVLVIGIAWAVAQQFYVIGLVLAAWALVGQVAVPVLRQAARILAGAEWRERRVRAVGAVAGVTALLGGLLFGVPVASWTGAEGVVWLPEQAVVRAGGDGFVVRLLRRPGQAVTAGEPLVALDDPALRAEVAVLEARVVELEAVRASRLLAARAEAEIAREALAGVRVELAEARTRLAALTVRSRVDGTFLVPQAADLQGRFVRQGERLGYVAGAAEGTVRVVVPQHDVDRVRRHTHRAEARFLGRPGESLPARLLREVPSASSELPSPVLGTQGGGAIAVDARDDAGTRAIDRVFEFDVALPPVDAARFVGARVRVRFEHEPLPLARQWERRLRQLFLGRFEI